MDLGEVEGGRDRTGWVGQSGRGRERLRWTGMSGAGSEWCGEVGGAGSGLGRWVGGASNSPDSSSSPQPPLPANVPTVGHSASPAPQCYLKGLEEDETEGSLVAPPGTELTTCTFSLQLSIIYHTVSSVKASDLVSLVPGINIIK